MSIDDPETPKPVSNDDAPADAETRQDEPIADEAPVDEVAADELSVDAAPADDVPVDAVAADDVLDDQAPDDAAQDDAAQDDEPIEAPAADESLIADVPADEASVGEPSMAVDEPSVATVSSEEPADTSEVEQLAIATEAPVEEAPAEEPPLEEGPRLGSEQLQAIVEALVFASPEPLTLKTLTKLLSDEPKEDVAAAVDALTKQYDRPGGLHFVEVAGGYQITTRPDCHEWVRRLFHERTTQKLSVQALETLAVIAYKQPITTAEIGEIRGVNTSGVLSTLLERHLVKIVGRKNVIGRPFLYATTREFLIRFGLKDLNDLPRVEDMAQALGFDAPAILRERNVSDEMLPLEEIEQGEPS